MTYGLRSWRLGYVLTTPAEGRDRRRGGAGGGQGDQGAAALAEDHWQARTYSLQMENRGRRSDGASEDWGRLGGTGGGPGPTDMEGSSQPGWAGDGAIQFRARVAEVPPVGRPLGPPPPSDPTLPSPPRPPLISSLYPHSEVTTHLVAHAAGGGGGGGKRCTYRQMHITACCGD